MALIFTIQLISQRLPSVGQYVEHLERLDFTRQKSELQSFHFKIYQTQSSSYAQQPLKLYSPSVDFNPKFNDTFSGILYPRPVQLTRVGQLWSCTHGLGRSNLKKNTKKHSVPMRSTIFWIHFFPIY